MTFLMPSNWDVSWAQIVGIPPDTQDTEPGTPVIFVKICLSPLSRSRLKIQI